MSPQFELTRRSFLLSTAAVGGAAVLSSCVGTGSGASSTKSASTTTLTLQNSIQDEAPKAALANLVNAFGGPKTTMNSVATEQFRAQLSTYLTSSTPPDVLSWYAGSVARDYAEQGLLLDVSDLWKGDGACAGFSDSLKSLSSAKDGSQIFVPTSYYWWSIFYKKSSFAKWGVEVPATWDEFIGVCDTLAKKKVYPLANGVGSTPWMASGWFDYLDLRVNGAEYHRELLTGKHSFTDKKVVDVMEQYKRIIPYFDPNQASYSAQEGATPMIQNKSAMYLIGAFCIPYFPKDQQDDLDFFSVPTIDPSIPSAEEAPTDGFFAAAKSRNPDGAKQLLSYLASAKSQEKYAKDSGSTSLPTSPDVDTSGFSPIVQKGIKLLAETKEVTQFFNRDSSDALQETASTALTKFLADPSDITRTLKDWQAAAKTVFAS
ncbi:substrate-binding domain-containing protein [Pengzhenrongella sp.]|jgi:multiple sugar transport system substrate-binding protein|uniref:ABC transporter substrate-binding protein n=1 Tax=Pengzhenrongella sp. TaxID=2888820 RepID=UPI002F94DC3A